MDSVNNKVNEAPRQGEMILKLLEALRAKQIENESLRRTQADLLSNYGFRVFTLDF